MLTEKLIEEKLATSSGHSLLRNYGETTTTKIFEELPAATIIAVSRADSTDFSPLLLSYTIHLQYKQFKWCLVKKASQVIYLHLALKKRAILEEFHEKQEQVKEWIQYIGLGDHTAVVHDDDEPGDGAVPILNDDSVKSRYVPSRAALPIIRPALGRQQTVSEEAKVAMQGYLNHFLGNLDIVNTREVMFQNNELGLHTQFLEQNVLNDNYDSLGMMAYFVAVCQFLEVSKLSFSQEYGTKLKEDFVMVKHLSKIRKDNSYLRCSGCCWPRCCNNEWQKVWAVLKPGFLALLKDPLDSRLLDILVFDIPPSSQREGKNRRYLAEEIKKRNPLRYAFKISSGNRSIELRTTSYAKTKHWISAINDAGFNTPEGWCNPHRFGSFTPPRGLIDDGSQAQWFIDGKAAFEAIASSLEHAKSEIYITGWWLCPELYLRRPFQDHFTSRLDTLLEVKAKQGVQIYILLYKEVAIALKINSSYSKRKLLSIHENIKVLRYPNRFPTGTYLWSHHEKLVIVDHNICYLGGLDLCFGRYDTNEHKVGDYPPSIWPGKDYYNPRESEPNCWEDPAKEELERRKYPRMPWHDVHCALWGPPCRDVARHFVQRWNHAKRNTAPDEQQIPLLMPQQHMVIPHYMGMSNDRGTENKAVPVMEDYFGRQDSFSSQSPPEDIPLLLPPEARDANGYHDEKPHGSDSSYCDLNQLTSDQEKDELGHADLDASDDWWERKERGGQGVSLDELAQVGPCTSCSCQIIRSVSHWSAGTSQTEESIHKAYCSVIEQAEHFIYIENQFFISGLQNDETIQNRVLDAIYKRILRAHSEKKCFRVIVVIPLLPGFQGGLDDIGAATVRAIMHWQYRTICRGKYSILCNLYSLLGPQTTDYISFYGLRTHGKLSDDGPLVTSQVYVHSKVMIVDDRISLVGSSNINDRSLLGSRDSEICVLIEDKEFVESSMNGNSWKAGKFSFTLRTSLWAEHLGLCWQEMNKINDPVADTTYKDLWMATAKRNCRLYQDVFACIPNEHIHSRSTFRQAMGHAKEKLGHTTIDLGVAPEKVEESHENGIVTLVDPMDKLKSVRGYLVSFPLEFMREEDLRPIFIESEFYTSPQSIQTSIEFCFRQAMGHAKEKLGHTTITIDLGVAPKKVEESHDNGIVTLVDPLDKLKSVRGYLVSFPLEFMHEGDIRPMFIESEYYNLVRCFIEVALVVLSSYSLPYELCM